MMQPGYYWAKCGPTYRPKQYTDTWRIVQAIEGLHGAVLDRGYSVKLGEYSEFAPVAGPGAGAQLESTYAELHDLRIRAGMVLRGE